MVKKITVQEEPAIVIKLIGSKILSNVIVINSNRYSLCNLVNTAFRNSGLSIDQWNSLSQNNRESLIGSQINMMRVKLELKKNQKWTEAISLRVTDPRTLKALCVIHKENVMLEMPFPKPLS